MRTPWAFYKDVKEQLDRLDRGEQAQASTGYVQDVFDNIFDGSKFAGGFGPTKDYRFVDYHTLRLRSYQLFTENLYAAGLIKRLLTNEINTGLTLEATPNAEILGIDEEVLATWSENTETVFTIWGDNAKLTDWRGRHTFGQLQRELRKTALLSGDALVVLRQGQTIKLPVIEIICGSQVVTPSTGQWAREAVNRGNKIINGVEVDKNGRHVAFYVVGSDGTIRRVLANGTRTGRRMAWLVYGSERRMDDVRGIPLLASVLQALKEVDRYKDAEQRAAVVNSMLALFVEKNKDKVGTRPVTGGAVRRDTATVTQGDGTARDYNISKWLPGTAIDELQDGEEIKSFDTRRPNVNFQNFEQAIIAGVGWSLEIPPEILLLSFNNNYSASRAAINEFKIYLDWSRTNQATGFCKPVYSEWLISAVLIGVVQAEGFLEAWRSPSQFVTFGAWILSEWAGAIKPSVDREKEVKAYERMVNKAWITNDRSSKELTGTKFSTNVRRIRKESEQLANALQPLIDAGILKTGTTSATGQLEELGDQIVERISDAIEEKVVQ
jgi:lambda family phage portal protein